MLCVIGSFLLGCCSWEKMRAYVDSAINYKLIARREKKGRPAPKVFNGKKIIHVDEANKFIGDALSSGRPFMTGRYGSSELNVLWRVREDNKGFITPYKSALDELYHSSGFFPKDKNLLIKFAELMKWSTGQNDLMAVRFNELYEFSCRTYGNNLE